MTKTELNELVDEAMKKITEALDAHVALEKANVANSFSVARESLNARMDKMFAELAPGKD